MRSTRKKVFGNRKKKEQLKAKREQKRLQKEKEDGTQALPPPTIISPEEFEGDEAPKLLVKRKDRKPKEEAAPVDDRNKCASLPPICQCIVLI